MRVEDFKYLRRRSDGVIHAWEKNIAQKDGYDLLTRAEYLALKERKSQPAPRPTVHVGRAKVDASSFRDGIWKGRRCFVVGSGASLDGFDFSRLEGELVICINRSGEYAPASLTYSLDESFVRSIRDGSLPDAQQAADFYNSPTLRVQAVTQETTQETLREADVALEAKPPRDEMRESLKDGIGHGHLSGFGAVNLAIMLGAEDIYLLGFDMGAGSEQFAHFHAEYPGKEDLGLYKRVRIPAFEKNRGWIRTRANVINLNPDSAMTTFPFGSFDDLDPAPKRPRVVSYYAGHEQYEQEARSMVASAQLFGLRCDVEKVDDLGGWNDNTYFKCEFLLNELKNATGPIAWMDADTRVRRYPVAFDAFCMGDYDIGLSYFNWSEVPGSRKRREELSTGVMLLRPTKAVFDLLEAWQSLNETRASRHPRPLEQRNLQDLLDKRGIGGLKPFMLPMSHNQIFDSMASLGDPVIEHFPASRKTKKAHK